MMFIGSCNIKTPSLMQQDFWLTPKCVTKLMYPRNIWMSCSKWQDLSVSITSKETNNKHGLADRFRLGSLSKDRLSYQEIFMIRCYEVSINKTATIETIANLFQEISCNHALAVGFSNDGFGTTPTMRKLHLIWVTTRMHIEIYKYPAWCDMVEIDTWIQQEGKIKTRRDFILKDYANGQVIGRATSKWAMMNTDTRKLGRVTPQIADEYGVHCQKALRLAFPGENNKITKKIPKLADPSHHSKPGLVPRRADLDMNRHVNNVTYIGWILESVPQEIMDTHELRSITLDYKQECQQCDIIDSLTSVETTSEIPSIPILKENNGIPSLTRNDDDGIVQFLHLLKSSSDGSEINRGRSVWKRKPWR